MPPPRRITAVCDSGVRAPSGGPFDGDALGHEGERVVERVDPLFEVEDAHVQEVHLGLVQAIHGVDDGDFEVGDEVLQISRHDGRGVPVAGPAETTESEIISSERARRVAEPARAARAGVGRNGDPAAASMPAGGVWAVLLLYR